MFEWNEEEKKVDFSHNPFSMPQGGLEALETWTRSTSRPTSTTSSATAIEMASGAIRNHRPEIMRKAFEIAGYPRERARGAVRRHAARAAIRRAAAWRHGAPGIDRIVMLLAGRENLREVTMFPMNQQAEDLLMGAPSEATPKQLRELSIRVMKTE